MNEHDDNAAVFRRVIEQGFNRGDFDAWDECFAPVYVEHQYGHSPQLAELKQSIARLRRAIPDLHLTIDELIASGDKIWARMTARGTQTAPLMGFPPSGRAFSIAVMDICRFEGGTIVEHWGIPDRFALLDQLGLLPRPAPAPKA